MRSVERDAFGPATGYPPGIRVDGIELRDRVWLDRPVPGELAAATATTRRPRTATWRRSGRPVTTYRRPSAAVAAHLGSVPPAEVAGQALVALGAGVVEADDGDVLALAGVLGRMASSVATVEASQMWEPDMSMTTSFGVADVVELVDEVVAGGEEQLAVDGVDAGCPSSGCGDVDDAG